MEIAGKDMMIIKNEVKEMESKQPKIYIFAHVDCDDSVIGVLYGMLLNKRNNTFISRYKDNKFTSLVDDTDVAIIVANNWNDLYSIRLRLSLLRRNGCYICGVCLGEIKKALTELPDFTVHTDIGDPNGLMRDIEENLKTMDIYNG